MDRLEGTMPSQKATCQQQSSSSAEETNLRGIASVTQQVGLPSLASSAPAEPIASSTIPTPKTIELKNKRTFALSFTSENLTCDSVEEVCTKVVGAVIAMSQRLRKSIDKFQKTDQLQTLQQAVIVDDNGGSQSLSHALKCKYKKIQTQFGLAVQMVPELKNNEVLKQHATEIEEIIGSMLCEIEAIESRVENVDQHDASDPLKALGKTITVMNEAINKLEAIIPIFETVASPTSGARLHETAAPSTQLCETIATFAANTSDSLGRVAQTVPPLTPDQFLSTLRQFTDINKEDSDAVHKFKVGLKKCGVQDQDPKMGALVIAWSALSTIKASLSEVEREAKHANSTLCIDMKNYTSALTELASKMKTADDIFNKMTPIFETTVPQTSIEQIMQELTSLNQRLKAAPKAVTSPSNTAQSEGPNRSSSISRPRPTSPPIRPSSPPLSPSPDLSSPEPIRSRWEEIKEYIFPIEERNCNYKTVLKIIACIVITLVSFFIVPAILYIGAHVMDYFCPRRHVEPLHNV